MKNSTHLGFSAGRWQVTRANHRAWWAGGLDRPLIHLTLPGRVPRRHGVDAGA